LYVGRIVVVGMSGRPFAAYRVSSRSFPNRVARIAGQKVAIEPLDPEDVKRNPYIAYNCIRVSPRVVVVSNGSHTDPISDRIDAGSPPDVALREVLTEMGYERDELNTPRIAGVVADGVGYLGIVRSDAVEVSTFDLEESACRFICTYELNRLDARPQPFIAGSAADAAAYVVEGGVFAEMGLPICSAAWMGDLAVYNPHQG